MKYCKVCQKEIPEKRVQLGYTDTCVEHSNVFKYVGFVAGTNKVDYEIAIVKNEESAKRIKKLAKTRGKS